MSHTFSKEHIIQPKLTIGQPNDKYEQEADAVADQVMRMPKSQIPPIQRKCEDCEEEEELQMKSRSATITPIIQKQVGEEEEELQMKPSATAGAPIIQKQPEEEEEEELLQMKGMGSTKTSNATLQSTLQQSKGGGQSLDAKTQTFMGNGIGADFSNVKIHTDSNAVQMNRQLNAKAFTNGTDVYFNQGQYQPNSSEGKHLLAHELTHVVQQQRNRILRQPATQPTGSQTAQANPIPSTVTIGVGCNRQDILDIVNETLVWLDDIYRQLLNYDADEVFASLIPPGPDHARVAGSVQQAFNTTDLSYVEVIRRRFLHMAYMLRTPGRIRIDCNGVHCTSGGSSFTMAYVSNPNTLTMCGVGTSGNRPITTFIHELAHAVIPQVGISNTINNVGGGVSDRAYRGNRAFRFLSPEETLDNADSYGVLAELLHSKALTQIVSPLADTAPGCSQPHQVLEAFSRADQWNGFTLHELDLDVRLVGGNALKTLNSGNLQMLNNAFPNIGTTAQLTALRDAFQSLETSGFDGSNWDFGCTTAQDRNCSNGVVAYSHGGKVKTNSVDLGGVSSANTVSICPDWFNQNQTDRIRTIYAAFVIGRPSWIVNGFQLNDILTTIDGAHSMTNATIPPPTTTSAFDHIRSNNQFNSNNPGSIP